MNQVGSKDYYFQCVSVPHCCPLTFWGGNTPFLLLLDCLSSRESLILTLNLLTLLSDSGATEDFSPPKTVARPLKGHTPLLPTHFLSLCVKMHTQLNMHSTNVFTYMCTDWKPRYFSLRSDEHCSFVSCITPASPCFYSSSSC